MIKRNFQKLYKEQIDPWNVGDAQGLIYNKILDAIKNNIVKERFHNILDLGCGKGSFTNRLAELGENVTGVEISSIAINYAKNHYPKIKFINGDIVKLNQSELGKGSFDLITALDVLYYFPIKKIRKILQNVFDLLEDNGLFVLRHWAPGGGYLIHTEWQELLSEKFNIIHSELLETGHSLSICQKKHTKIILTFDYETWQPLPKGKVINWEKDILEPTERLLDLADKNGIKLSFFAEIGEYYWCKKYLPEIALKMENQWREIIKRGHDVQIHLHPAWLPECGAKFDKEKNEWHWNDKYQRIHDVPINIEEVLRRCKNDLERILKPINSNYQAIVFRAGKYQIQPNKDIFEILKKVGIKADSSVWKGGYSEEHKFDFRKAYSNHQPYFASKYNINYLAPWGETEILEIPIASNGKEKFSLDSFNVQKGLFFLKKILKPHKRSYLRFNLLRFPPNCFSKQYLNQIYNFLIKALNKIENIINEPHVTNISYENNIVVGIGHTKLQPNILELEKFFKYIVSNNAYKTELIRVIANQFNDKNNLRDYEKHIKQQIDYDRQAILGEKRNWQQSFYAQEKIPLDRKIILDLGCGAGYWTKRINDNIAKTVGVDISDEFLDKAKKEYPGLEFYKMDFHKLDFPDEGFDCVYADNVLEHSPYPQKVLKEVYRVLTGKGLLVALIPPDARNPRFSGRDHIWKTDKDEIEERLQEIGFSNIQIEDIDIVKKFKMSPYKASNNSILLVTAWKWENGYNGEERCKDIMNFVYNSLSPERSQKSNDPIEILKRKYAWCAGYVVVMKYLCEKEGFQVKHFTLYAKDHPKGRGTRKIDTHEVIEVLIDGRWIVFDPTVNRCLEYDLKTLLKDPKLVDKILLNYEPDKRWVECNYDLYCSSWFYKNIIKYKLH
ncbi:methyltransferase domain-containing protein [Caldisericum sp.]|uniref:methyltransferase domain-containing protein n=1 Tax=Caldisericum sp. TaxID=2499687 RepID=UPI003D1248D0